MGVNSMSGKHNRQIRREVSRYKRDQLDYADNYLLKYLKVIQSKSWRQRLAFCKMIMRRKEIVFNQFDLDKIK